MTHVDENRLKGNYGAAYVALRLSSEECLVRTVPSDTDVGVDLFCESVDGEEPFLHFWVQVKTGSQCKVAENDLSASCSLDRKHLSYWYRQPVPVFVALVPTQWPVHSDPVVYLVDVTSYLIEHTFPGTASLTMHSHFVWQPGDQEAIQNFLKTVVPFVSAKMLCRHGVIAHIPTLRPEYEQRSPLPSVSRYRDLIFHQIRKTAAFSVISMWGRNTLGGENSEARRTFARVVAQFEDDPHWENFMALAISHHAEGEFEEAIRYYELAKQSILGDPNVVNEPNWQTTLDVIEKQIAKAHNKNVV